MRQKQTAPPSAADDLGTPRRSMRRVSLASFVGTMIEYYDFYIFGTAAVLVFPHVFFPNMGTTMATISSLATFAVVFVSRPVGAAVFGHYGDRLGRKKTLVATLLIMGLSTVAVGLVPSAATVGVAAPVALMILRLLQGFAVGGEWAGAALLSAEYAPKNQRGKYGMAPQLGAGAALVMSNFVFLAANATIGEKNPAFIQWGWRLPFLFSAVLVAVALYVRLNVEETPVFAKEKSQHVQDKAPLRELFRKQSRAIILASGCMVGVYTMSFMISTYLMSYASTQVGHTRNAVLSVGVLGGFAMMISSAISATLSDSRGRRRVMMYGFAVTIPWSFAAIPLLDTGSTFAFGLCIIVSFAIFGVFYGPLASFIPEIFATRYRYTGAALAFNLSGIVGGAVPPLIAGTLVATVGGWSVGLMMAGFLAVSMISTVLLPETGRSDLASVKPA